MGLSRPYWPLKVLFRHGPSSSHWALTSAVIVFEAQNNLDGDLDAVQNCPFNAQQSLFEEFVKYCIGFILHFNELSAL